MNVHSIKKNADSTEDNASPLKKYKRILKAPLKNTASSASETKEYILLPRFKKAKKSKIKQKKFEFILPKIQPTSAVRKTYRMLASKNHTINSANEKMNNSSNEMNVSADLNFSESQVENRQQIEEADDDSQEDENEQQIEDRLAALLKASSTIARKFDKKSETINCNFDQKLPPQKFKFYNKIKALSYTSDLKAQDTALALNFVYETKKFLSGERAHLYPEFLQIFENISSGKVLVENAYFDVINILKDSQDLCDRFLIFLTPAQAAKVGKYCELLTLERLRRFVDEIKYHFQSRDPCRMHRLIKLFKMSEKLDVAKSSEFLHTFQSLLKSKNWLFENLVFCVPSVKLQECCPSGLWNKTRDDFEEIDLETYQPMPSCDKNSINSDKSSVNSDKNSPNSSNLKSTFQSQIDSDSFEHINFIDDETMQKSCSDDCQCECHSAQSDDFLFSCVKQSLESKNCVTCGIKFIGGRVYIQYGKNLKLAKVTLTDSQTSHFKGNKKEENKIKIVRNLNRDEDKPRKKKNKKT